MATETPAQMAARFRKIAQDPKLPQAVKNTYLDKAIAVEKEAAKPTMAKGGAVVAKAPAMKAAKAPIKKLPMPAMAKGGDVVARFPSDKDKKAADKDKYITDSKRANEMDRESTDLNRKAQNLKLLLGSKQSQAVYGKLGNMAEEDAEVLTERAKQLRQSLDKKTKMAKGGAVTKSPKAPATKPAMKKAPALAVMIAVGKPKAKMAKGGSVKKGC